MPEPPPLHDLAAVVHLHSVYSDGTGTVPEIARAARRDGVDVVLLTDHDTLEAKDRGEEGYHDGVLVLVGEEVSPRGRNHYLAFGIDDTIDHRGLSAAGICAAVGDAGGFGFAAHPFSKGSERFRRIGAGMPFEDLDCEALHGLEVWSFVTDTAERLPSLRAALGFLARPGHVLRHPPEENLREWDRLGAVRPIAGLGGIDAHQFGKRVGPFVPLRTMSYRRSFQHLRTHVLARRPLTGRTEEDRESVYEALRAGRANITVDSVADPRGFAFWAEGPAGSALPGEEAPAGDWTLHVRSPLPASLRLVHDGRVVATAEGKGLEHRAGEPGVWRAEARREARGAERTWVLTNPVYLR